MWATPVDAFGEVMDYLTYQTLAQQLGVSTRHLRRLVERGLLPAPIRVGGVVRFPRREVERAIAKLPRA